MTSTERTPELSRNPESEFARKVEHFVSVRAVIPVPGETRHVGKYFFISEESPVLDNDFLLVVRSTQPARHGGGDETRYDIAVVTPTGEVQKCITANYDGRVLVDGAPYEHEKHGEYAVFLDYLNADQLEPDALTRQWRQQNDDLSSVYEMTTAPIQGSPGSGLTP